MPPLSNFFLIPDLFSTLLGQNANEVEKAKETIKDLRLAVQAAKEKQKDAQDDCKKLERDMDEFKNNKDGKIEQLKVCSFLCLPHPTASELRLFFQASISKQKSALQKHSVIVKTQHKELQTATLELGMCVDSFVFFLGGG